MHRIIGAGLGALATYLLLFIFGGSAQSQVYLTAVIVGLIVTIAWPWVITFILARRIEERRNEQIEQEVQERMKLRGG